jgi:DNA-directed RNA polymerase subunit alpha
MSLFIKQIKAKQNESIHLTGHFIISNLNTGDGLTLGNSLRRVLLGNLVGTALIAIKIQTNQHEFSRIPGLREDTFEFLLNLKEITLKTSQNRIHYGKILATGPGILTANCLHFFTSNIEVINPTHYLATIYTKKSLNFDIIAIQNKGYQININNKLIYPDFLNIDAIFVPILNVNYKILENLNYYNKKKESLLLEIITNGSYSPRNAFNEASLLLETLLKHLKI